ncbi:MAG: metalloregulator ArsR/SmtB family transcription factor [Alphaproteobacteria bacterium]|nr:metalloregulator ArsR/SmtB family transcription factor [Alphaproteobacteria bacterium]
MPPETTQLLSETFKLLADPTRLAIVFACKEAPRPVGEIAGALDLSQSLVSHHLRLLRAGRLVAAERHGKHVLYRLNDAHIARVLTDMAEHVAEDHEEPHP